MISKVTLKNFRIFHNQAIDFPEKGLILIAGPNGSGKSSIGMAIGFALNLSAFHSYRKEKGIEINSFIKEGTDESLVTLDLVNKSSSYPKPFSFEEEKIKIQRRLRRFQKGTSLKINAGSRSLSSYRLLYDGSPFQPTSTFQYIPQGKLGDLIPTKYGGASQLDYFDEFIKYIALVEDKTLSEARENYEEAKKKLDAFTITHFRPAEEKVQELEEKFRRYKAHVLRKDSELSSGLLLHSALLIRTEDNLQSTKHEKGSLEEDLAREKENIEIKATDLAALDIEGLKKKIEEISTNIKSIDEELQPLALELRALETSRDAKNDQIAQLDLDIEAAKLELETNNQLLSQAQRQLHESTENANSEVLELLTKAREEMTLCKSQIEEIQTNYEASREQLLDQKHDLLEKQKHLQGQQRKLRQEKRKLESARTDPKSMLSKAQIILNRFIRSENLQVIGPAANYVTLNDAKYAVPVQYALGPRFLLAYATEKLEDQRRLDQYILENNLENINIYYLDPEKTSQRFQSAGSTTPMLEGVIGRVEDLIQINHPLIQRTLLEFPARRWVICSTSQVAETLALQYRETAIMAHGSKQVLTKRPLRASKGMQTSLHSSHLNLLSQDLLLTDIEGKKQELIELEDQAITLGKQIQEKSVELEQLKKKTESEIKQLQQKESSLLTRIAQLEAGLGESNLPIALIEQKIAQTTKILENGCKARKAEGQLFSELVEQSKQHQAQVNSLTNKKWDEEDSRKALYAELELKEEEAQNLNAELETLQRNAAELVETLSIIESDIETYELEANREKDQVKDFQQKISQSIKALRDKIDEVKATNFASAWIEIFEAEIKEFEAALRQSENRDWLQSLEIQRIEEDYLLAKAAQEIELERVIVNRYDYARRLLQQQKSRKEQLEEDKKVRDEEYAHAYGQWYAIVSEELEKLKLGYRTLITEAGGKGYIQVHHLTEERSSKRPYLSLRASFHSDQPPRAIASHLHSGGESTLILLAFILALQSLKPQPIYFFDEPDAHLDPKNRDKLFRMIKAACGDSQYFVFSPQDLEERHQMPDAVYYVFKGEEGVVVKEIT